LYREGMSASDIKEQVRRAAYELGFSQCGFAALSRPPHAEFVESWIAGGNAAGMGYLERKLAKRLDPQLVLRDARSMISVGWRYAPPPLPDADWQGQLRGRIAAYALDRDYHKLMTKKLDVLARCIETALPGVRALSYVDTGPILEREWAAAAGVGWFGKNTNLLHQRDGSWFFIGELITTAELAPDAPLEDRCGTCTRCLDLCPTGALHPGYRLDARRCISYWTIEHRGWIPAAMRPQLGNWIFGCDECQEVCPWNDKLGRQEDAAAIAQLTPFLPEILQLDEAGFAARFRGTALWRTGRAALARNAAIALGNGRQAAAVPPLVRGSAAWALARVGGAAARQALQRQQQCESDAEARAEIAAAIDSL
jgi:epoxyqueuosine reductase